MPRHDHSGASGVRGEGGKFGVKKEKALRGNALAEVEGRGERKETIKKGTPAVPAILKEGSQRRRTQEKGSAGEKN